MQSTIQGTVMTQFQCSAKNKKFDMRNYYNARLNNILCSLSLSHIRSISFAVMPVTPNHSKSMQLTQDHPLSCNSIQNMRNTKQCQTIPSIINIKYHTITCKALYSKGGEQEISTGNANVLNQESITWANSFLLRGVMSFFRKIQILYVVHFREVTT